MANSAITAPAAVHESSASSQPLRILLVEDPASGALQVRDLLREGAGGRIECDHVTRLQTAVSRVAEEHFDLVLLDLSLAGGAGSSAVECASNFARTLPVVVLARDEDDLLARQAIEAGAADYMTRTTLGKVQIAEIVECAVDRHRRMERLAREGPSRAALETPKSLRDPLTGLMSEALFNDRLEHCLARSGRHREPFALVALRLNELAAVSEARFSVEVMRSAAKCLSRRVRKSDSLARISSDSFGVMINGLSDLAAVNSTVGSFVLSLSSVSLPEGSSLGTRRLSTSVGVSIHPDNGCESAALLDRAMQFEFATARIGLGSGGA